MLLGDRSLDSRVRVEFNVIRKADINSKWILIYIDYSLDDFCLTLKNDAINIHRNTKGED
jgi:hypothetical protein